MQFIFNSTNNDNENFKNKFIPFLYKILKRIEKMEYNDYIGYLKKEENYDYIKDTKKNYKKLNEYLNKLMYDNLKDEEDELINETPQIYIWNMNFIDNKYFNEIGLNGIIVLFEILQNCEMCEDLILNEIQKIYVEKLLNEYTYVKKVIIKLENEENYTKFETFNLMKDIDFNENEIKIRNLFISYDFEVIEYDS